VLGQRRVHGLGKSLAAATAALLLLGCADAGVLAPASPEAEIIALIAWLMFTIAGLVMGLVLALLGWALLRGRRDREPGGDDVRLVILGGIALPLVVLPILWFISLPAMAEIAGPDEPAALQVDVIGHQWAYEVRYPGWGVTVWDELHLPLGERVLLRITSADVIHSFWVPELGGKRDMIPGRVTELTIRPTREAVYSARCAEFCGVGHALMTMRVTVERRSALEAWLEELRPGGVAPAATATAPPAG
jgi:cytochrome c oxidase subunit II